MFVSHYKRFFNVLRSPQQAWWPYGGADWNMFALWTLLINSPPREEALKSCSASKVVRELRDMPPRRRRLLKVRLARVRRISPYRTGERERERERSDFILSFHTTQLLTIRTNALIHTHTFRPATF